MKYPQFKVRVDCMTFNHSKYITDAMNGFTMQQTDFPYICTIVDDASTDGEQNVIRKYIEDYFDLSEEGVSYEKETEYANIIYAQHKTNNNCFFAALFLKENYFSQKKDKSPYLKEWNNLVDYIAFCEGDDYWIDPLKLQKQVDILDKKSNVSMVHTSFICVNEKKEEIYRPFFDQCISRSKNGLMFSNLLLEGNYPLTVTVMLHKEVLESQLFKKSPSQLDFAFFLSAASFGEFEFLPEKTSCYRRNPTSLTSTIPNFVNFQLEKIAAYFLCNTIDGYVNATYVTQMNKIRMRLVRRAFSGLHTAHIYKDCLKRHKCLLFLLPLVLSVYIKEKIFNSKKHEI